MAFGLPRTLASRIGFRSALPSAHAWLKTPDISDRTWLTEFPAEPRGQAGEERRRVGTPVRRQPRVAEVRLEVPLPKVLVRVDCRVSEVFLRERQVGAVPKLGDGRALRRRESARVHARHHLRRDVPHGLARLRVVLIVALAEELGPLPSVAAVVSYVEA